MPLVAHSYPPPLTISPRRALVNIDQVGLKWETMEEDHVGKMKWNVYRCLCADGADGKIL